MNRMINRPTKLGSYSENDVIFLLKDLSETQLEDTTKNREKKVQSGEHYSESLPIEYEPPEEYVNLFLSTLHEFKQKVALYIGVVSEQIYKKRENTILVSLARAGTPVGILIKRYIERKYHVILPHYSISIIRDRGIDENALLYILEQHPQCHIQFIDGWTGKGAITVELTKACLEFEAKYNIKLNDSLAVIADPGSCTTLFGTREDFLVPSACLNSTVSGLVSRTVLNEKYIGKEDFHGAKYYSHLIQEDLSNDYIKLIDDEFPSIFEEAFKEAELLQLSHLEKSFRGMEDVRKIQQTFQIENTHHIKPGVGETTRVLLRRIPWKILMRDPSSPYVQHIIMLANEKGVEIVHYPDMNYLCCGLIQSMKRSVQ